MALQFQWDRAKAISNLKKHGVSFNEASSVFKDELSATGYDPDHSMSEHRFITVGLSDRKRNLIVSHTDRRDVIRIISARKATRREIKFYEEND
ncbi:MAG: BrnT family toxin [Elusimicrobia bacterium]|nr:BrnT family toxin [Elusimicrobiota bacterium]